MIDQENEFQRTIDTLEEEVSDIKQQLTDKIKECNKLGEKLEKTEQKLEKEKATATSTKIKLDGTSEMLKRVEIEIKQVRDTAGIATSELTKCQEKLTKYEQDIESEIQEKVGQVI